MKNLVLAIAVMGVSGCANTEGSSTSSAPVESVPYTVITDQAEFNSLIVDKTLVKGGSTTWMVKSDGSLGGSIGGAPVSGTWVWDGAYCREGSFGSTALSYDCQKVEKSGTNIRFTRSDGTVSDGWKISG